MSDATIKILQQIREDIAQLSARTDARFDGVHARIDDLDRTIGSQGARLEHIEGALVAILNLIGKMNERFDTHDALLSERAR